MPNTLIIMGDINSLLQMLIDRTIVFFILSVMLITGAFVRNSTMDKTSSWREMLIMSVFLAVIMTFLAGDVMKKVGFMYFLYALIIGLVEKETLMLLKRLVLNKIKGLLGNKKE